MLDAQGALLAGLLSALQLTAQTDPVIRSETRIVQVDVSVRDSQGRHAGGLTREDFTLSDAGRNRKIRG